MMGFFLRDKPTSDAKTLQVLDFDQVVEVLESSDDQKWQKVRLEDASDADTEIIDAGDETEAVVGWVQAGI